MNKINLAIYPFCKEVLPILYLPQFKSSYVIKSLIAAKGFGMLGRDAGYIDNRKELGIVVSEDLEENIALCDTLFISAGNYADPIHAKTNNAIEFAMQYKKNIICAANLSQDSLFHFQTLYKDNNLEFMNFSKNDSDKDIDIISDLPEYKRSPLYKAHATVIFVGNLVESHYGFEILLRLTKNMSNSGYKVCAMSCEIWSELFNVYKIPSSIFYLNISNEHKVYLINKYIRQIEMNEHPDLIIIQIPDSYLPYNKRITCGFGITPFIFSQAIQPDYFVCTSPMNFADNNFLQDISNNFFYKYGYSIDYFHVLNCIIDSGESEQISQMSYLYLSLDDHDHVSALPSQMCNIMNDHDCENICTCIRENMKQSSQMYSIWE